MEIQSPSECAAVAARGPAAVLQVNVGTKS